MSASARRFFALMAVCLLVAACASQPAPDGASVPGFFFGLWNGFTMLFSLIGSAFMDVRIYAFPNSGWWYDLGFFLGVCGWSLFLAMIFSS